MLVQIIIRPINVSANDLTQVCLQVSTIESNVQIFSMNRIIQQNQKFLLLLCVS